VRAGWFTSEAEVVGVAILDFARRNRVELLERFMRGYCLGRALEKSSVW